MKRIQNTIVIASPPQAGEAIHTMSRAARLYGLLRRYAPRNDGSALLRNCIAVLLCLFLWPVAARAQCTMPGGPNAEMGVLIFNKDHKVMQYCDGSNWVGMGGGSGGGQRVSGEIAAFDLGACPDGWSEYLPARGRFLRGIDNGAGNDPGGTRVAGNVQADTVQQHDHYMTSESGGQDNVVAFADPNPDSAYMAHAGGPRGDVYIFVGNVKNGRTSNETRPKNVAVLYCRKN